MKFSFDKFLGRIFLSILFFIFLFTLAETITFKVKRKDRSPFDQFNDPVTKVIKPYVMFGGKPNGKVTKYFTEDLNSLGYRGELPSLNKNPEEYRIFMLGGSTVMFGVPSLPQHLEKSLHEKGYTNIKVFNFGVISSETGQDIVRLLHEFYDFQPDLVIMYEGGNDIMDRYFVDPRPGYPYNFIAYEKNPLLIVYNFQEYPLFSLIALRSVIFRSEAKKAMQKNVLKLEELRKEIGFGTDIWKAAITDKFFLNMRKGRDLSKLMGAQFIGIAQPLVCTKKELIGQEKDHLDAEATRYCSDMVMRFRDRIKELKNDNSQIYDYTSLLDDSSELMFMDYIHLSSEAENVLVNKLVEDITKQPELKR